MLKPIAIAEDVFRIDSGEPLLLSFLVYYDDAIAKYFIKSLDFSVDSEGDSIEECQTNIQEAIQIHLEDCEPGISIFDPAAKMEWDVFVDLKIKKERQIVSGFVFLADETTYLLSTQVNRESLQRSLEQFKAGEFVTKTAEELGIV